MLSAAGLLMTLVTAAEPALAGDPLLTGKTVSLIHPAIMLFLFGASGYTAYLGFQWKYELAHFQACSPPLLEMFPSSQHSSNALDVRPLQLYRCNGCKDVSILQIFKDV